MTVSTVLPFPQMKSQIGMLYPKAFITQGKGVVSPLSLGTVTSAEPFRKLVRVPVSGGLACDFYPEIRKMRLQGYDCFDGGTNESPLCRDGSAFSEFAGTWAHPVEKTEKARDWGREQMNRVLLDAKGLRRNEVTSRNGDAFVIFQGPSADWSPGWGRTSEKPWKSIPLITCQGQTAWNPGHVLTRRSCLPFSSSSS